MNGNNFEFERGIDLVKSIFTGMLYGLITIFICATLYALIASIYYHFFQTTLIHQPKQTIIATYIIICISGIVAAIKAKRHILPTSLALTIAFIFIQLFIFSSNTALPNELNDYVQLILQFVMIFIGAMIGISLQTLWKKN